jgi:hypothetical protein
MVQVSVSSLEVFENRRLRKSSQVSPQQFALPKDLVRRETAGKADLH